MNTIVQVDHHGFVPDESAILPDGSSIMFH